MVTFDGTPYASRVMGYGGHGDVLVLRSTDAYDDGGTGRTGP
jgi:hypothetical protein